MKIVHLDKNSLFPRLRWLHEEGTAPSASVVARTASILGLPG